MNAKLFTLTTFSLLVLTACGGGGSADNPNNSPVVVNSPTKQQGTFDAQIFSNGVETFHEWGLSNSGNPLDLELGLNVLNLEGRQLEIIPTNISGSMIETTEGSTGIRRTVGGNLSYARYGVISLNNEKKDYVFFQGIQSSTIPTTGTATYKGYAVAYRPADRLVSKGTSSFEVNFANKTLTGEINTEKFGNFKFTDGEIHHKANNFKNGDFSFKNLNATNAIFGDGGFYGENAAEMAGSFVVRTQNSAISKNDIYGTFGAKKQGK